MTLHEAIAEILREAGHPMTTAEIAAQVNRRRSYTKKDGTPVTAYQIHGRTKNYDRLFTRNRTLVGLCERPAPTRKEVPHAPARGERQAVGYGAAEDGAWVVDTEGQDVGTLSFLETSGFVRLGTVRDLIASGLPRDDALQDCGVYAIVAPSHYTPRYVPPDAAVVARNVIRPWAGEMLAGKWVVGAAVVYYGVAGRLDPRSLRKRLYDLIRHAAGKTTDRGPHKGGEIVWQLKGYKDFSVWALSTPEPPAPRDTEAKLLKAFEARYGSLPFGNRQI